MRMRRIEYERLCFETELLLGEKERIDGRSKIYLVRRQPCLVFAFWKMLEEVVVVVVVVVVVEEEEAMEER